MRSINIKLEFKQPVNYPYYRLLKSVNANLHYTYATTGYTDPYSKPLVQDVRCPDYSLSGAAIGGVRSQLHWAVSARTEELAKSDEGKEPDRSSCR